jgi:hypothetical protein
VGGGGADEKGDGQGETLGGEGHGVDSLFVISGLCCIAEGFYRMMSG